MLYEVITDKTGACDYFLKYYEERTKYTESSYLAFQAAVDAYGSYMYVNSIVNNDNIDSYNFV